MITLYKGINYNNSYNYIKLFSNEVEQGNYFNSLPSLIIADKTGYIKTREYIDIKVNYDKLIEEGYNYLEFSNGYKNIYAFITNKEYRNEKVTRLYYEIDVCQTYQFDFQFDNSFVERKVCSVNEITDFDEGLELGEHSIVSEEIVFQKEYTYFAMFNGIKEQSIIFDDNGRISSVVQLPFATSRPLTVIDGIQYPLYFLPLQDEYAPANYLGAIIGGIDVVQSARKLLGKPYVWGGNYPPLGTDEGTDCSGLCQWAYNDCGKIDEVGLSGRWTTYTMYPHFTQITHLTQAKPGDVIFSNFSDVDTPEHVALISHIDGDVVTIIEALNESTPIHEINIIYDDSTMTIGRAII